MTLQRRLMLYLLVCAPIVWAAALAVSVQRARHEVNELFDSEMIRLARQVQVTLDPAAADPPALQPEQLGDSGEADLHDLAIAVWNREGKLQRADREGVALPWRPDAAGFVDLTLGEDLWRVYYLQSFDGRWLVAAGQKVYERDEIVFDLTASQLAPWLLVLPVLLGAMAWAVRQALRPVRDLTRELASRSPDDLQPVPVGHAPAELAPMVEAMNGLFHRIDDAMARERRFTADAAHELRTPLAVLRAQWDVVRRAPTGEARREAEAKLGAGLDRMDRLVTQLLALSRLDTVGAARGDTEIDWPVLVEEVFSDCLPLAERRGIELACDWPAPGAHPFPLLGDPHLLAVLLRNLVDNAVRYAPAGSTVTLRFGPHSLAVDNEGPPLDEAVRQRLGERFYRPDGQDESGTGLGVSIARRIASLHGLTLTYGARPDGQGVVATLAAPGG